MGREIIRESVNVALGWSEQGQIPASLTEEMATVTFSLMVEIFPHF